jgi:CBS domain-containing protein
MKVNQVMNSRPVTVHTGTSVGAALRQLAAHAITMMPVVDDHGRILGVVAEGDLLERDVEHDSVSRVMRTGATVLVHPDTPINEAGIILHRTGLKSLPVVDAADQVVGVVSRSDIVRMLAREDDVLQEEIVDALCVAGVRDWRVQVHNGIADLTGPPDASPGPALEVARGTLGVRVVRVGSALRTSVGGEARAAKDHIARRGTGPDQLDCLIDALGQSEPRVHGSARRPGLGDPT